MDKAVQDALRAARKNARDQLDLQQLRGKMMQHKAPDKALLAKIDAEIARLGLKE